MTTNGHISAGDGTPGENNSSGGGGVNAKPTDMELMLYWDGELDEARCKEVESYLQTDTASHKKLEGLSLVAGFVREQVLLSDCADDILASVMTAIEVSDTKQTSSTSEVSKPHLVVDMPFLAAQNANPKNDNFRRFFSRAVVLVAAAAAMVVWVQMRKEPTQAAINGNPSTVTTVMTEPSQKTGVEVAVPEAPSQEVDMDNGVEVAAVDFGAHMGTIFYVPNGSSVSNSTTTVVWVADDIAGEN